MARHPWVAKADDGIRFGVQFGYVKGCADAPFRQLYHDDLAPKLVGMGQRAEELGFDAVFVPDHPSRTPDPWIVLAGLATTTSKIYLGSVVWCAFYRHPTMTARLATDLDRLSGGRLMLGLGIGWDRPEFDTLQIPFLPVPQRQAALEEVVAIVQGVWGDEPFGFQGDSYTVDSARIEAPQQRPRPPVMIAGGGERTTLRQVARLADACNFDELMEGGIDVIRRKLDVLSRHCADAGRPHDEILRTHYTNWLILASTEQEVRSKVARYFPGNAWAGFEATVAEIYPKAEPGITDRMVIAGTPAEAIAYYRARAAAGIQYFVVALYDGTDLETLELLAREVVPGVVDAAARRTTGR